MSDWDRDYDLNEARKNPSTRIEAVHQSEALTALREWYEGRHAPAGGLLVLPTGGGKTFTAVRFLCRNALSDGYKILWLAHTHHLLEQALDSFGKRGDAEMEVGLIHEPKERLHARVVSGTIGHSRVAAIKPSDDVVICTLQTAVRAHLEGHAALRGFLESSNGKVLVVFDEAHHAPAPSYAEFILALRKKLPKMKLLGLTATPIYNDKSAEGWLPKLFPQRILYEVSTAKLIAAGILAKPIPIPCSTTFAPKFDAVQYQRWRTTYQDVPEEIITQLAQNQERNDTIWKTYVERRADFGKTIIFADRWFQCDYLREKLRARGVKADVLYSHVDADPGSAEARNRRARDENAKVLKAFHQGEVDVLINVRMLAEGTDVPKVQTVFLTRQTTSPILLRQMVGRALRGPKFNGTATANIVLFMDDWREAIQWAEVGDLFDGETERGTSPPREAIPLRLVSIEVIRRLARQMESGDGAPASFLDLLPVGWYVPEYDAEVADVDDAVHVSPMVLVFEDEKAAYEKFIAHAVNVDLRRFRDPALSYDGVSSDVERWQSKFFTGEQARASGLGLNLFHVARHIAQAQGRVPPFFAFDERDEHDLTPHAERAAQEDWGPSRTWQYLEAIYLDERRFWRALFPRFDQFRDQFRLLVDQVLRRNKGIGGGGAPVIAPPGTLPDAEPSEEVKQEVVRRDGSRCLCCGSTERLQVDHIISRHHGGTNEPPNLQTLCAICNNDKDIQEMHFRKTGTLLRAAPPFRFPPGFKSGRVEDVVHDVQRTVNMFYQCAAIDEIAAAGKGAKRGVWRVRLRSGNAPGWLEPHLGALADRIRGAVDASRAGGCESVLLEAPGVAPTEIGCSEEAPPEGSSAQTASPRGQAAPQRAGSERASTGPPRGCDPEPHVALCTLGRSTSNKARKKR